MLLAIGVLIAGIPGYTSAVILTGWPFLLICTPILLWRCKIVRSFIHWCGACFLAYAAISVLWAPHALFGFMQMSALAAVFLWAETLTDMRRVAIGTAAGLGASAILAIFQYAGWATLYFGTEFPGGLFINSNLFAEMSALVLVLLMVNRLWWWLPVTIPGLAIGSRASLIALLCVVLAWVWSRSRIVGGLLTGSLGVLTVYSVTTFGGKSITQRFGMWMDTIQGLTFWGHGIGSFEYLYPYFANRTDTLMTRPSFAHNDLLQLIFELGIGVVPLLVMLWYIARIKDNHRYVLLCFGIIGLFGFPLHIPASAFIATVCAGYMVGRERDVRAERGRGRPIVPFRVASAVRPVQAGIGGKDIPV